jgi:peptide/nickel transport system ATP-binding protein
MATDHIIKSEQFVVQFPDTPQPVFAPLNLAVPRGVIFGIFGETGCGKTTLAQCLAGFVPPRYMQGQMFLHLGAHSEVAVHCGDEALWRRELRGQKVVYVPQDPYKTLNPYETVGSQLARVFRRYGRSETVAALLAQVGLRPELADAFPHTLSAGQKQRAMVAHVLAIAPALVILDEPTASVDAEGRKILQDAFRRLLQRGSTLVVISHEIEEYTPLIADEHRFYFSPVSGSIAKNVKEGTRQQSGTPLLQLSDIHKNFVHATQAVLRGVSLHIAPGEWLYLEGRNGCGKTTLLHIILGLLTPDRGQFDWQGVPVPWPQVSAQSRYIHAVFQDTFHSLNPGLPISDSLREVVACAPRVCTHEVAEMAQSLWQEFSLSDSLLRLLPHQLSYGQQKRVCLLRTLLKYQVEKRRQPPVPHLLLLDEVFAGIHWELRERILRLLSRMRADNLSILWIAHGHNELKDMCDRVCRLQDGVIVS